MKWFKHMSQSHTDEKLALIVSECGLEGYGFWWMLMEVVAAQCVDDKCSATYTLPHWSRLLYCHHHKVVKYLLALAGLPKDYPLLTPPVTPPVTPGLLGVVTVGYSEGKIRVTIPNLLKYRDEYSRKSRQHPAIVPPKKENKKEKQNNKPIALYSIPETVFHWFWKEYSLSEGRGKQGNKLKTKARILASVKNDKDAKFFYYATKAYLQMYDERHGDDDPTLKFMKHPEVFANEWQGYIPENAEERYRYHLEKTNAAFNAGHK